jgi:cytochrome c
MRSIRLGLALSLVAFGVLSAATLAAAEGERATAEEVVHKVKQAATVLAEEGEAGLTSFRGPQSSYVWKDTYVFVSDCDRGIILANPFQPEREGKRIADGPTYGGVTAAARAEAQCAAARQPGGGWWIYPFPGPGRAEPVRKVSYVLMVPGRPWIVGAGVYDETTPIEEFEAVSRAAR